MLSPSLHLGAVGESVSTPGGRGCCPPAILLAAIVSGFLGLIRTWLCFQIMERRRNKKTLANPGFCLQTFVGTWLLRKYMLTAPQDEAHSFQLKAVSWHTGSGCKYSSVCLCAFVVDLCDPWAGPWLGTKWVRARDLVPFSEETSQKYSSMKSSP